MLASNPKELIDLYEFLPPEGESELSYQYDGSRLCVDIYFDDEVDDSVRRKRSLVFTGVCSMHITSVPGVNMLDLQFPEPCSSTSVIEFTRSEAAKAWSSHFGWKVRHFRVYFSSENQLLVVFAEDCKLE